MARLKAIAPGTPIDSAIASDRGGLTMDRPRAHRKLNLNPGKLAWVVSGFIALSGVAPLLHGEAGPFDSTFRLRNADIQNRKRTSTKSC